MLPHGRLERRIQATVPVYLTAGARQVLAETAFTENVSKHGARILTRRKWLPDEQVQVESIQWSFRAIARVAYCEPLRDDEFAVGLQFIGPSLPLTAPEGWTPVP
jgi:hypothetical protein